MKKRLKNYNLDKRPWGNFERFTLNEKSTVKVISVLPNKKLSLQSHKKREEFWYFLDNPLEIVIGNRKFKVKKGDSVSIPKNTKHRVIGLKKPARFLEIAFGNFSENDIKRFEDEYGRE